MNEERGADGYAPVSVSEDGCSKIDSLIRYLCTVEPRHNGIEKSSDSFRYIEYSVIARIR